MNKGQGIAMGAILAAVFMLRTVGSSPPQGSETVEGGKTAANSPNQPEAEAKIGPWIASCNYWAPARLAGPKPKDSQPEISGTVKPADGQVSLHVNLHENEEKKELGCGGDPFGRWGFPKGAEKVDVTAIIAIVPDPVHTHLGLAFDRTVEAILQGASDGDYVSSYYWLPWKNRAGGLKFAEALGDAEPGHDPERERQPGLIILKHVPRSDSAKFGPSESFDKVIYLFLAAETPTLGIDGFQLQNALSYEAELKQAVTGGKRFSAGANGRVAIIGPQYSGSAASLRVAIETQPRLSATKIEVAGATTTSLPIGQLRTEESPGAVDIRYLSFASDADYSTQALIGRLKSSGYDIGRAAILGEDNTAAANALTGDAATWRATRAQVIRYPREISLLRNAEVSSGQGGGTAQTGDPFSPYLRFSLKDYNAQDSVPQFSRENTPLSQEAELMTIARQLHRSRAQFIAISGSNVLDQIFLTQFLHRACPDARLVFFGSDLLMVRDIDSAPFVGSITITPYPLIGIGAAQRAYTNSTSEAFYNAVTYTLWHNGLIGKLDSLKTGGYYSLLDRLDDHNPNPTARPPLWATAIGRDGYYPLAVLSPCASDYVQVLPTFNKQGVDQNQCCAPQEGWRANLKAAAKIYPSQLWIIPWAIVCLLCISHILMLLVADYRSPFTRDLAIGDNDQPRRRSTYVQVATAMLFSMAVVVAFPMLWLAYMAHIDMTKTVASLAVLALGVTAVIVAICKTRPNIGWAPPKDEGAPPRTGIWLAYGRVRDNACVFLNLAAWAALVCVSGLWIYLCSVGSSPAIDVDGQHGGHPYLVGLSFCFRAIHTGSGVSPMEPVLLLLFSWYLWAFYQTWRLRFSDAGRPRLPLPLEDEVQNRLFLVSDTELDRCAVPRDACLYKNITCLFITREALCRLLRAGSVARQSPARNGRPSCVREDHLMLDILLAATYAALLFSCAFLVRIRSLDHFLWNWGPISSPYEILVGGLFFSLIAVSLAGWFRMILIWGALKRGLLERLEYMPIRYAFSRLKVMGWMTMLRSGGLQEQWQDIARSLESIRQMLHQPDLDGSASSQLLLDTANASLLKDIRSRIDEHGEATQQRRHDYELVQNIETRLAEASRELLANVLIPYWRDERTGLVESEEDPSPSDKPRRAHLSALSSPVPARILVAEEFVAIRYLSLIRAVLANLRYLMLFISASFVLAVWAWDSYPFEPRQLVDWSFTGLLVVLGSGVVWVLAQMHRNPILSRITDTKANELGGDFYLRVVSFGILPVLTWLAYEFPDIGNLISKFLLPGVPVIK